MKRKISIIIALVSFVFVCASCSSVKIKKDCGCGSFNEKAPSEVVSE